ncbi:hypothetical protein LCGC14_1253980 [marine sediment metagenome]|uniref:Uncharacterized protein n=1 Tax=marine sediment metagenome TaxID=412755 RepID=A0A0F9L2K3_9ZZZZ
MLCEIINPSDPYTMECENFVVGAVAVCLLGGGKLGLDSEDGEHSTPVLFGWDDWFKEQGISDLPSFLKQNKPAIADALDSVRIGDTKDRLAEVAATKYMTPEDAEKYRAKIHNNRRSSMNDIGSRAWQMAKALKGNKETEIPPESTIILGS